MAAAVLFRSCQNCMLQISLSMRQRGILGAKKRILGTSWQRLRIVPEYWGSFSDTADTSTSLSSSMHRISAVSYRQVFKSTYITSLSCSLRQYDER